MPSFDVVSEIDHHELSNAVDQANREISNRFDFKGTNAKYTVENDAITLSAPNDFQITGKAVQAVKKIKGLNFVAPPNPYLNNPEPG